LIRDRGLFDLPLKLEPLDPDTSYDMLTKYLASARRPDNPNNDGLDPVHPFTPATARALCDVAQGVPRWLNRYGSYILLKAAELQAPIIDEEMLAIGLDDARTKLRGPTGPDASGLLPAGPGARERGAVGRKHHLAELEKLKVDTFNEILPSLDKLVTLDLLQRMPTERATEYAPPPLLREEGDGEVGVMGSKATTL
jgi:hypothetical protein